jgi:hypothetical protein
MMVILPVGKKSLGSSAMAALLQISAAARKKLDVIVRISIADLQICSPSLGEMQFALPHQGDSCPCTVSLPRWTIDVLVPFLHEVRIAPSVDSIIRRRSWPARQKAKLASAQGNSKAF